MRKWFYVLELEGGYIYAGITGNLDRRVAQHRNGTGAEWTRLHKPIRVLFSHGHEVPDDRAAEALENRMTVNLMIQHGRRLVRGGHFCAVDPDSLEMPLRAHGYWDEVRQSEVQVDRAATDWEDAARRVLALAESFHLDGCRHAEGNELLVQLLSMKAHRHWRDELDAGLKEQFWGRKGLLPIFLSFRLNRVVGSKLQDPFAVLAAALQRGRGGNSPWSHLCLAAWDAYVPTATESQAGKVEALRHLHRQAVLDRQFDEMVILLFPETRWRLR